MTGRSSVKPTGASSSSLDMPMTPAMLMTLQCLLSTAYWRDKVLFLQHILSSQKMELAVRLAEWRYGMDCLTGGARRRGSARTLADVRVKELLY